MRRGHFRSLVDASRDVRRCLHQLQVIDAALGSRPASEAGADLGLFIDLGVLPNAHVVGQEGTCLASWVAEALWLQMAECLCRLVAVGASSESVEAGPGCRQGLASSIPVLVHARAHHLVALCLLVLSRRLRARPSSRLDGCLALRGLAWPLHGFMALRSRPLRPLPLRTRSLPVASVRTSRLILLKVRKIARVDEGMQV